MAITVIKDYTFPFAKNDDYIYLDSDNKNENQYRYGLHLLYDKIVTSGSYNPRTLSEGYIDFNITDLELLSTYSKNTNVYLNAIGVNFIQYNPVPLFLTDIVLNSGNSYRFYFDVNKLRTSSEWWYIAFLTSNAITSANFDIYKCVTKKVAANNDGYGVFSVNDINRELLNDNIINYNTTDLTLNFKYLPFEEYLYKAEYNSTSTTSTSINQFEITGVNVSVDKLSYAVGDVIIIENDSTTFYNGTQKCISFLFTGTTTWQFTTDKPALDGVSLSGGVAYRADYAATPFTNELDISGVYTCFYSGLKYKDVSGLNNTELNDLVDSYINGEKYFTYSPIEQNTYLNDLGYLTLANNGATTFTYAVTDSENVVHNYTLSYSNTDDVFKVVSNPASINNTSMTTNAARGLPVIQECDKSYTITNDLNDVVKSYTIKQNTKFERVRLLFSDMLGSLNGFNFALYNAIEVNTTKDTYTQDYVDFSNLNTIKFNNQSRGKTDIATKKSYRLTLNSDFLTQDEGNYFEDLLTSNNVFAQYKGDIIAVNIPSTGVTIKEKINGLIRYSIKVEYSIKTTQW